MATTAELRNAERISTERPIDIQRQNNQVSGKMLDLSVRGLGFVTDHEIKQDDTLCIGFQLPNYTQPLSLCGIAKHANKVRNQYLIGIEFDDVNDHQRMQINEFIANHHRLRAQ